MRIGGDVERSRSYISYAALYYYICHLGEKRRTGLGRLRVDRRITAEQNHTRNPCIVYNSRVMCTTYNFHT